MSLLSEEPAVGSGGRREGRFGGGVSQSATTESIAHYSPSGRLQPSQTCKSIEWDSIKIKYAEVNGVIQRRSGGRGWAARGAKRRWHIKRLLMWQIMTFDWITWLND